MTREETNNMFAGKDTEESPVMVSAALGDHFAQVRNSIFAPHLHVHLGPYPAMPLIYSGLLPLLLETTSPHLILSRLDACRDTIPHQHPDNTVNKTSNLR